MQTMMVNWQPQLVNNHHNKASYSDLKTVSIELGNAYTHKAAALKNDNPGNKASAHPQVLVP